MVGVRTEAREFSLFEVFRPASGPTDHCSKGAGGCFPRIQMSRREAVHAPPSSAKVGTTDPLPHKSLCHHMCKTFVGL